MATIYLLRHGETAWNRDGRMQGRRDSDLTPLGQVQAARQGAILRHYHVDAPVLTSPLGRARRTAALAGLRAGVDPRLAEISMGAWEGRTLSELGATEGVRWKFDAPGGETMEGLQARLSDLLSEIGPEPRVLVTHGVICIALQALLLGWPTAAWDRLDDPQGVVLRIEEGRLDILR